VAETIGTAFVLGAGLGTRLRPLTDDRPKPLVPIVHKPLITFAFDHLHAFGVRRFVVNTHHRPEAYGELLGETGGRAEYRGCEVAFRHEPVLLETGGGIGNIRDLVGDVPFLVHNGDVLADLPLQRLIDAHLSSGNVATLGLRSFGGPCQVQFDAAGGLVTDIRGAIGGRTEPGFLFTGIYVLSPEIFAHLPDEQIFSIIPVFLNMIRKGARVGGVVLDEGLWFDLGTRASYLEAHDLFLRQKHRLSYSLDRAWPVAIDPSVRLSAEVTFEGATAIGAGVEIGENAHLTNCVIWENAKIASRARLEGCIVRSGRHVEGNHRDADL
jgi:mannose-1-phosphate guanylyltransferase